MVIVAFRLSKNLMSQFVLYSYSEYDQSNAPQMSLFLRDVCLIEMSFHTE